MCSGEAGCPDLGAPPEPEADASRFAWADQARQRRDAARAAEQGSTGAGDGSSGASGGGEALIGWMLPNPQAASLNYFIPVGACAHGGSLRAVRHVQAGLPAQTLPAQASLPLPPVGRPPCRPAPQLAAATLCQLVNLPILLPARPPGVVLGLTTLACLALAFWWRRRIEHRRQPAGSGPGGDEEQGGGPRASLGEQGSLCG